MILGGFTYAKSLLSGGNMKMNQITRYSAPENLYDVKCDPKVSERVLGGGKGVAVMRKKNERKRVPF